MLESRHSYTDKRYTKPIGEYLIEAGLVTSVQVETALNEQKQDKRRLGELLVAHGWVEQSTIEYLMEKIVLPERQAIHKKLSHQETSNSQNLISANSDSHSLLGQPPILLPLGVPSHPLEFCLAPRRTLRFLFLVVISVILASISGQLIRSLLPDSLIVEGLAGLFNVDAEKNIPSLFSTSLLLVCSILLATIAYAKKVAGNHYALYWGALSIIFLFLSWDEAVSLHEQLIEPLRSALHLTSFLYYAWVIPGAIFLLLCLLVFLRFLIDLPVKTRRLILIAGTLFVTGALGSELVGGYYSDLYTGQQHLKYSMTYSLITAVEEFLEMLGIAIFIYALLSYVSSYMKGLELRVRLVDDRKQRHRA